MTADRWRKIENLYHGALDQVPEARAAYLIAQTSGDADLRREVEELLAEDEVSGLLDLTLASRSALLSGDHADVLPEGSQLGPYRVESLLGEGGMGQVYRARDSRLSRYVAVKVAKERFSDRFASEAQTIAQLNHPNICTIHDVGTNYLVMECLEGQTLKERMGEGRIPLEEAQSIAGQIIDALEYAHDRGVIHKDLKPGNITILSGGTVKLLDFGLAQTIRASTDPERSGEIREVVLGTPAYMSPEQARGKPVDRRTDVWAFGVILYEMLTGERLFEGGTTAATLHLVTTKEIDAERIPPQARRVIERCLVRDPKFRLRDIGEVRFLWNAAAPLPQGRRRWRGMGAIALAGLFALPFGYGWWRSSRLPDRPLVRLNVDLGTDAIIGPDAPAALSPDGTRIVYHARAAGNKQVLATRLLNEEKPLILPGTEGATRPFFSPDGRNIGFFAEGKLQTISVQGGAPTTLCDAIEGQGASWAEDGSIIAALNLVGPLSRISGSGGAPAPATELREGERTHRWPQLLPGSREVIFTASISTLRVFEDASVEVQSFRTGARKLLVKGAYFGRYIPSHGTDDPLHGHLLYVQNGVLFGIPFDAEKLEMQGKAVPLLNNLAVDLSLGDAKFGFSQTGTFFYLRGEAPVQEWFLSRMDREGNITPILPKAAPYRHPRFSPDGTRLAFDIATAQTTDLYVHDFRSNTTTRLTFAGAQNREPVWTPDGQHIVYRCQSPTDYALCWMRSDGAGEPQRLLEDKNALIPYSFASNGRLLAYFQNNAQTAADIWLLPLDLTNRDHPAPGTPQAFLRTRALENEPEISPGGGWIAYSSNESGRNEIYVRRFPGPGGKRQVSLNGGSKSVWSRDGHQLYFRSLNNQIMVVDYTTSGNSFQPGTPRVWSQKVLFSPGGGSILDLAPDGRNFAIFSLPTPPDEEGPRVTFLMNFFDDVRRRASGQI